MGTQKLECVGLSAAVIFLAASARADDVAVPITDVAIKSMTTLDLQPGHYSFAAGSFDGYLTAGFFHGFDGRREDMAIGTAGVGYYFVKNFSINAEFPVYGIFQNQDNAVGAGFNLLGRWHFLTLDRWSFYLDGGAGLIEADHAFPAGGTHFNFTEQVGLGLTYALTDSTSLMAGARYAHVSNAGIDGGDRNPSINSAVYGYVGVMLRF